MIDVDGAGCRSTPSTPATGYQKSAKLGSNTSNSGKWQ
jgi:hypothetical protein